MICTHGLSTDTPCLKCALANASRIPAADLEFELPFTFTPTPHAQGVLEGYMKERSRIRALFLKHYSNDWNAVQFLKELDE